MLSGECSAGVTAEERARAVALLGGLGAALPLRADEGKDAGEHDAAMGRESQLAARVFGTARAAGLRDAVTDEEWWLAARFVSGMPPELGPSPIPAQDGDSSLRGGGSVTCVLPRWRVSLYPR